MIRAIEVGKVIVLGDGVSRLTAPNPGMMTGPGTNTYLVGTDEVAVIDPGPLIEDHLQLIAESANIRWIIATHTHPDHSRGVARLASMTGAEVIGMPAPAGPHQDRTFAPGHVAVDGELLAGSGFELKMFHTPGHASNHFCFLHTGHRWLFTGDHVMAGSTVVIDPPDGDMKDYLDSLRRLRELALDAIAPGHGPLLDEPRKVIDWIIEHRLEREKKVYLAVSANPGLTSGELVMHVYQDVDERLHDLAERSLLAHLIKLEHDASATCQGGRWLIKEA